MHAINGQISMLCFQEHIASTFSFAFIINALVIARLLSLIAE
jgi:hypothetical protein